MNIKKINKDRITVAIIANADGSERIKPIVIGKHQKPRCFGKWNPNSIVSYYFNSNAWMTQVIFEKWLIEFNRTINRDVLFTKDAWLNVSKETIANCWRKAGDYLVYINRLNCACHVHLKWDYALFDVSF